MKVYVKNIKAFIKIQKQGRFLTNKNVYKFILIYTIKYFNHTIKQVLKKANKILKELAKGANYAINN
jgi:hypothetical protein